jgi:hypothetical protein
VDPVPDHYFSENLVALGIEPGPLDLQPRTLTTRPQRRSNSKIIISYNFIFRFLDSRRGDKMDLE